MGHILSITIVIGTDNTFKSKNNDLLINNNTYSNSVQCIQMVTSQNVNGYL